MWFGPHPLRSSGICKNCVAVAAASGGALPVNVVYRVTTRGWLCSQTVATPQELDEHARKSAHHTRRKPDKATWRSEE